MDIFFLDCGVDANFSREFIAIFFVSTFSLFISVFIKLKSEEIMVFSLEFPKAVFRFSGSSFFMFLVNVLASSPSLLDRCDMGIPSCGIEIR